VSGLTVDITLFDSLFEIRANMREIDVKRCWIVSRQMASRDTAGGGGGGGKKNKRGKTAEEKKKGGAQRGEGKRGKGGGGGGEGE